MPCSPEGGLLVGYAICPRTRSVIVLWTSSKPCPPCERGVRIARNASSRFGPSVPLVPASASVWHVPQLLTNSCLPTLALLWLLAFRATDPQPAARPAA